LRGKMEVREDFGFSKDYLDPQKRSIANAVQVFFKDGSQTENVLVEYPLGHRRRRNEGIPLLMKKFETGVVNHFESGQAKQILDVCNNQQYLLTMPVHEFMQIFVKNEP